MTENVSTLDVRQRIGDLLNRVFLRHDEFIIERKGQALAALVPIERMEQLRRVARHGLLELLEKQHAAGAGGDLSDEQALELALEGQRWARQPPRKKATQSTRPRK